MMTLKMILYDKYYTIKPAALDNGSHQKGLMGFFWITEKRIDG